jgi:hypothetical protein
VTLKFTLLEGLEESERAAGKGRGREGEGEAGIGSKVRALRSYVRARIRTRTRPRCVRVWRTVFLLYAQAISRRRARVCYPSLRQTR